MKRQTFLSMLAAFALTLIVSSCYTEPNPLNSVAKVGDPVAIVRTFNVVNPATNALASAVTVAAGTQLTFTTVYSTLESPVTAVNLYTQVGSTRTRVANAAVNVSPSPNRVTQNLTYTIPATAAVGSRIVLVSGVVTAGGESWSGTGVSASGTPPAGTVAITVR